MARGDNSQEWLHYAVETEYLEENLAYLEAQILQ